MKTMLNANTRRLLCVMATVVASNLGLESLAQGVEIVNNACPGESSPLELPIIDGNDDDHIVPSGEVIECDISIKGAKLIVEGTVKGSITKEAHNDRENIEVRLGGIVTGDIVDYSDGSVHVIGGTVKGNIIESKKGNVIVEDSAGFEATLLGGIWETGRGKVLLDHVNVDSENLITGNFLPVKAIFEDSKGDVTITDTPVQGSVIETGEGEVTVTCPEEAEQAIGMDPEIGEGCITITVPDPVLSSDHRNES